MNCVHGSKSDENHVLRLAKLSNVSTIYMPKWAVPIQASVGYWTGMQVNILLWCSVNDMRHAYVITECPRATHLITPEPHLALVSQRLRRIDTCDGMIYLACSSMLTG